jgi:hypothetical protein
MKHLLETQITGTQFDQIYLNQSEFALNVGPAQEQRFRTLSDATRDEWFIFLLGFGLAERA